MAECAKLNANITVDCDKPLQAGTRDNMVLINYDDWLDAVLTLNVTNEQIIEGIALASGITGYKVEGQNNSNIPKPAFVRGRYSGAFDHEVKFVAFDISPTAKAQLEKLCKGRVVAIVENAFKGTGGETSFEVYGADAGLIVPDGGLTRDPSSADTQGAYEMTLKSSELSREAHLPATIYKTDYTTRKAIFDSLYV